MKGSCITYATAFEVDGAAHLYKIQMNIFLKIKTMGKNKFLKQSFPETIIFDREINLHLHEQHFQLVGKSPQQRRPNSPPKIHWLTNSK